MSWKKDVLEAIKGQQDAIDALILKGTQEQAPTDAQEDFATTQVISKRNYLEAIRKSSDFFKDGEDGANAITLMYGDLLNYKPLTSVIQWSKEYWFELINWYLPLWRGLAKVKVTKGAKDGTKKEDKGSNEGSVDSQPSQSNEGATKELKIDSGSNDAAAQPSQSPRQLQKLINDAIDYGIAFGRSAIIKENDEYKTIVVTAVIKENSKGMKVEGVETKWLNNVVDGNAKATLKKNKDTYTLNEDAALFEWDAMCVGDYYNLLPWLGVSILFNWQKVRNYSFMNIIQSVRIGKEESASQNIAAQTTNPLTYELDVVADAQAGVTQLGDRIKWFMPEGEKVEKIFAILEHNDGAFKKKWMEMFGLDGAGSDDKQDLNKKVEAEQSSYKPIQLVKLNKIACFVEQLNDIGLACECPDYENEMEEESTPTDNEGNTNATKDETKSDKNEGGFNEA